MTEVTILEVVRRDKLSKTCLIITSLAAVALSTLGKTLRSTPEEELSLEQIQKSRRVCSERNPRERERTMVSEFREISDF